LNPLQITPAHIEKFYDHLMKKSVDAEQVLENKLLIEIFKDYLTDDGLREEVIKRIQKRSISFQHVSVSPG